MKFGMFYMSEYANMLTSSALIVTLYLGGWQIPYFHLLGVSPLWTSLLQVLAFCLKVGIVVVFFILVRWTIPRFRYDQLMNMGWKVMLPLSILNVLIMGIMILLGWIK
jgi:NADH-quinone oxidoreductase subunit H